MISSRQKYVRLRPNRSREDGIEHAELRNQWSVFLQQCDSVPQLCCMPTIMKEQNHFQLCNSSPTQETESQRRLHGEPSHTALLHCHLRPTRCSPGSKRNRIDQKHIKLKQVFKVSFKTCT